MFEKTTFHRPQVLPISNYLKGGDFMGLEGEINRMIYEGSPVACNPTVKNSSFPEVVGRTRFDTALKLAGTGDPKRPVDWPLFGLIREMDDVTG